MVSHFLLGVAVPEETASEKPAVFHSFSKVIIISFEKEKFVYKSKDGTSYNVKGVRESCIYGNSAISSTSNLMELSCKYCVSSVFFRVRSFMGRKEPHPHTDPLGFLLARSTITI